MKDSKKFPTDKDLLDLLFSDEKLLAIGDKLFELLRQEKVFTKHKIVTYVLYEYANNITYNFLLENHPSRLDSRYKSNPLQQVLKDYWKKSIFSSPVSPLVTGVIKSDVPPYLKNTILVNRISPSGALTIDDVQDPSTVNMIVNSLLQNNAKVLDVDIISKLLNEGSEQAKQRAKLLETYIDFLDDAYNDGELNFAKKPELDGRDKKSLFEGLSSLENKTYSSTTSKSVLLNLDLDQVSGLILNPFKHSSVTHSLMELASSSQNHELRDILEVLLKKYEDIWLLSIPNSEDGQTSSESEFSSLEPNYDNISELSDDDDYQNFGLSEEEFEDEDDEILVMQSVSSGSSLDSQDYSSAQNTYSKLNKDDNHLYHELNSSEYDYGSSDDDVSFTQSVASMSSSGSISLVKNVDNMAKDDLDSGDDQSFKTCNPAGVESSGDSHFVRFDGNNIVDKNKDHRLDQDAATEDAQRELPYVGHQATEYSGNLDDAYNKSSKEGERQLFSKILGMLLFPFKILFIPVIILYRWCFRSSSNVESKPITTKDLGSESSFGVSSPGLANSSVSRDGGDDKINKDHKNTKVM